MSFGASKQLAFGGAAALALGAVWYVNGQSASKGVFESGKEPMELKRRPSWAAKVRPPPADDTRRSDRVAALAHPLSCCAPAHLTDHAAGGAAARLPCPSLLQFEGPDKPVMTRNEVDAKAEPLLQTQHPI